jgi:hypothetical protein
MGRGKKIINNIHCKNLSIFAMLFVLCGFWLNSNAQGSPRSSDEQIEKAIDSAISTYKHGGTAELISFSTNCHTTARPPRYDCLYFDLASRLIEGARANKYQSSVNHYFSDEPLQNRLSAVLVTQAEMEEGIANDFYKGIGSLISEKSSSAIENLFLPKNPKCLAKKFAEWQKRRSSEINKWCAELARSGEECRISAGQDAWVTAEARNKFQDICDKGYK